MLNALAASPNSILSDNWHSSFTAWTTRVSNPVCSPRFRTSASVIVQWAAFAAVVPPDIYEFHLYTWNSTFPSNTQARQFQMHFHGWAVGFHIWLKNPPTHPLRPVIPNNACTLRITAAAGTELAGAYSYSTVIIFLYKRSLRTEMCHPPRGVAASDFRPLCNIPHCCLP